MKIDPIHILLCSALAAALPLKAQMSTSGTTGMPNQPGSMTSPNGAGAGTGMAGAMTAGSGSSATEDQAVRDKMFIRKAAEGGMAEVQLGQLAADKATSPEVKSFGQKMVTDHTTLNNDMKPIADSLGVMLPKKLKKEDQAEYDKLSALSGDDFDKEYLTFMVKDHHMDLREFRQESAVAQDPSLKAAVDKGFAVIREHTQMVDRMAREKGIRVPQRGGQPAPPPPTN